MRVALKDVLLRRSHSDHWSRKNPVLQVDEAAVEIDTASLKIGDGVTRWNDLPYATPQDAYELLLRSIPRTSR